MPLQMFIQVFPIVFILMFVLVFGMFVVKIIQNIGQWNRNNQSPRLTAEATVVSRRTEVRMRHHTGSSGGYTGSSTSYYVTFQVESGDRMELSMKGSEYGMLAEGDRGQLCFQGTRYLGFQRIP